MLDSATSSDRPPLTSPKPQRPRHVVSFLVLAGVCLTFAVLFFQVIRPLVLPLFLGAVVALLGQPLHLKFTAWFRGRSGVSAGVVTLLVLLTLIGPMVTLTYLGFAELHATLAGLQQSAGDPDLQSLLDADTNPQVAGAIDELSQAAGLDPQQVRGWVLEAGNDLEDALYKRTVAFLGDLPGIVLGVVLFVIAVFFFLKDGEKIVRAWDQMTPLDPEHDVAVREEFSRVCRGVVWGTLAAALAQALMFGAGFLILDWSFGLGAGAWVFFLALLTLVCATIPFLGAASVWVPTALVLFLQGHHAAAICLAVYGGLIVSQVDTVIRVWVLKDTAKLHPLFAFVCVFGGIQLLGILGVFVGPVVGAVLLALMRIVKNELLLFVNRETA